MWETRKLCSWLHAWSERFKGGCCASPLLTFSILDFDLSGTRVSVCSLLASDLFPWIKGISHFVPQLLLEEMRTWNYFGLPTFLHPLPRSCTVLRIQVYFFLLTTVTSFLLCLRIYTFRIKPRIKWLCIIKEFRSHWAFFIIMIIMAINSLD
jgi:hypothetical protein